MEINLTKGAVCQLLETDNQTSMGCGIERKHQGQNLTYEMINELARLGFNELGVHRIYTETISHISTTTKLCKSLCMRKNGYFR